MTNVEAIHYDDYQGLYALKDFHQGEVIIPQDVIGPDTFLAVKHSSEPNAAVRNGRLVAWACIKEKDEITIAN